MSAQPLYSEVLYLVEQLTPEEQAVPNKNMVFPLGKEDRHDNINTAD